MNKLLFLDVDSVLNSERYMKARNRGGKLGMDPDAVTLLVDIVNQTRCKIVVSSAWRLSGIGSSSDFYKELKRTDSTDTILKAVIGATPILNRPRGKEIRKWIDSNSYIGNFVIVDDSDDMCDLMRFLVRTTCSDGLTREIADDIIEKLNCEKVLFLDVDGVIRSTRYEKVCEYGMDPEAVALLIDIVEKTNCKIVVSSSWRYGGIDQDSSFYHYLKEAGGQAALDSVIDMTPVLGDRINEIETWMSTNNFKGKFVIVDDLKLNSLKGHTVRTTLDNGLTKELAKEIIKKLNR